MKNKFLLTRFYIFTGFAFLTAILRDFFPFEHYIEWIIFLTLIVGVVFSIFVRVRWFAFYCGVLALFYNPLFLVFHDIQNSKIVDIILAMSFFMIGLNWQKYEGNEF